eukprot:CAMPEP_0172718946 /NCGR_PEP_ID=MMETSP1074-20121228/75221_1 /TAXON_ID=2916 /ORGANISM="Ceratium fusus, Strain PA161109" /LENGTH=224 /DNA_ID=CAMNT_0013544243 /DNA_START=55 /DNA_END=729 /DNA_ORIENTATION=+
MSKSKVIFSHRIDAADYADDRKTCCLLPMRGGTIAFAILFTVAGVCQLIEMVDLEVWHPKDIMGGPNILFILAACMTLSGVSGLLGAIFQIRFPITMFCILLLVQIVLELCWFTLVEQTSSKHRLQAVFEMVWCELLKGNRSNDNGVAGHLFYTLFSMQFHLWATGVVASYALELRIAGKAVLFEPIIDDEDDEEAPQAPLVDKKDTSGASTDYGATTDQQPKA